MMFFISLLNNLDTFILSALKYPFIFNQLHSSFYSHYCLSLVNDISGHLVDKTSGFFRPYLIKHRYSKMLITYLSFKKHFLQFLSQHILFSFYNSGCSFFFFFLVDEFYSAHELEFSEFQSKAIFFAWWTTLSGQFHYSQDFSSYLAYS